MGARLSEKKKLPRAQPHEGKLHIEGEKEPYVQGAIRTLWLIVRNLQHHRTFEIDDDYRKVRQGGRIRGTAAIERDTLTVAGSGLPQVRQIPFFLRPMPEEEAKLHWQMSIGFLPHDWEIGNDDEYYCECYAPEPVFNELAKAYLMGKAEELRIGAKTSLWVRHFDWYAPVGVGVTWYLVPSTDRQSDIPDHADGTITRLSWSDGPMEEPEQPPDEEEEEPRLQVAEQKVDTAAAYRAAHLAVLGKVSSSLLAILVTLIVLAVILLLKH